jgi:hypothetical protein
MASFDLDLCNQQSTETDTIQFSWKIREPHEPPVRRINQSPKEQTNFYSTGYPHNPRRLVLGVVLLPPICAAATTMHLFLRHQSHTAPFFRRR